GPAASARSPSGRRGRTTLRPHHPVGRRDCGRARALLTRRETMKVDGGIGFDLAAAPATARDAEEAGYDGIWSAETSHDPFFPLLLAAGSTERIELGTGIALAFPRSPMHLAYLANDLQLYSQRRCILGL